MMHTSRSQPRSRDIQILTLLLTLALVLTGCGDSDTEATAGDASTGGAAADGTSDGSATGGSTTGGSATGGTVTPGMASCVEISDCITMNCDPSTMDDAAFEACAQTCFETGTDLARLRYNTYLACAATACEGLTGNEFNSCVGANCGPFVTACFGPSNAFGSCTQEAPDCILGTSCVLADANATNGTCLPLCNGVQDNCAVWGAGTSCTISTMEGQDPTHCVRSCAETMSCDGEYPGLQCTALGGSFSCLQP